MNQPRRRGFLRLDEDSEVEAKDWGLPDYTAETHGTVKETALNYDPSWVPDAGEIEEEAPQPLTLEEVEQIRQDAYQEGLLSGKEAGFTQGYEKGKEQGIEEGKVEGVELGKAEGYEAEKQQIEQAAAQLIAAANNFTQPLELMNAQVEKQLVDMVLHLTKEVIHVEATTNHQVILDAVKESVDSLPIAMYDINFKMHPEDIALVEEAYGVDQLSERKWSLIPEPSLNRGDLLIDAGDSRVDYRLEDRIQATFAKFCSANRHQRQV